MSGKKRANSPMPKWMGNWPVQGGRTKIAARDHLGKGTLAMRTFEPDEELDKEKASHVSLTIRGGEKLYLPRGVKHSCKNFGDDVVKAQVLAILLQGDCILYFRPFK